MQGWPELGVEGMTSLLARQRRMVLATMSPGGQPHLVPIVFIATRAASRVVIWHAIDHKPKSSRALARLANLERNPSVSVLADHYAEDWTQLWWIRLEGQAEVRTAASDPETATAIAALQQRYAQYRPISTVALGETVIRIEITRHIAWCANRWSDHLA